MGTKSQTSEYRELLARLKELKPVVAEAIESATQWHEERRTDGSPIFRVGFRVSDNGNLVVRVQRPGEGRHWVNCGQYPVTLFGDIAVALTTSGSQQAFKTFMAENGGRLTYKYGF